MDRSQYCGMVLTKAETAIRMIDDEEPEEVGLSDSF